VQQDHHVMIERGRGAPLVVVPGIAGRWEWMSPIVDAFSRRYRVLTFSLGDVEEPDLFSAWSAHIDRLLDRAGVSEAAIVGVSFGGLIACHFAATRPARTSHLVLASAPAPEWRVNERTARLTRAPRLLLPVFAWQTLHDVRPEVVAAIPSRTARIGLAVNHMVRAATCPPSPRRMVRWLHAWTAADLAPLLPRIAAATLVLTGEPGLDRIVPVESSREYLRLIRGATGATLERTGHLGFITRPDAFEAIVTDFMEHHTSRAHESETKGQESTSACI
jgi:pimeloyl-ACP methyl ester carboxylesterase